MEFRFGLRFSVGDTIFIVVMAIASIFIYDIDKYLFWNVLIVLVHFFFFCNVFYVSRVFELIRASLFLIVSIICYLFHVPVYIPILAGFSMGAIAIALEMRKQRIRS